MHDVDDEPAPGHACGDTMISAAPRESQSHTTRATERPRPGKPHGWRRPFQTRGQTIVEFGLVVLLFVLLISGMFDFGLSLNARLSISSLSRILARAAAEGATPAELAALANAQGHIIGVTTDGFAGYCCDPGDAIVVTRKYCLRTPEASCSPPTVPPGPQAGDRIVIDVTARGLEVFTPLARPVFGCNGSVRHCFVPVSAQTTMRVEPTPTPTAGP